MAEQIFQIGVKGQFFMLHIPEWGHNPAHWDLRGGIMDPGETSLDTKAQLVEEI
jgi:hypothetical protein